MRAVHAAILIFAGLAAAGCVNTLALRQQRLAPLVGQPDSVLIQVMGVPSRTYETGGVHYLAYDESRVDVLPGFGAGGPWGYGGPWPYNGWYGNGVPSEVVVLLCETTFQVQAGTVRSFNFRGNAC